MKKLNLSYNKNLESDLPEKIIQFGEGNFLRGFVDWMIHQLNKKGLFNGRIVAVQPTPHGKVVDKLNAQNGLYTTILQGIKDGQVVDEREIITSVSRGINPYKDWHDCLKCAENPEISYVFSNTTEAGLPYDSKDTADMEPPLSYPGKLTLYLYHRYKFFQGAADKGMLIVPCELLEENGTVLKKLVLRYCSDWKLPMGFKQWIEEHNLFLNTLVDRVVSGYPKANADKFVAELGYEDQLMVCGEVFHFFAIEGDASLEEKLPFSKIGLNVVIEREIAAYRKRKVRILNGAHTASVPAAFLAGIDTVGAMMADPIAGKFVRQTVYKEIIPSIDLDGGMLTSFADAVIERFQNPFITHYLLSILLNSSSKFYTRVIPSIEAYIEKFSACPERLLFSFAAYIMLYKNDRGAGNLVQGQRGSEIYEIIDDAAAVVAMRKAWQMYEGTLVSANQVAQAVLKSQKLWKKDSSVCKEMTEQIGGFLFEMDRKGIAAVMARICEVQTVDALHIHEEDTVAVALRDLKKGSEVRLQGQSILLTETIPRGHKFALQKIGSQEDIIKYGFPIGSSSMVIEKGSWVHTHNIVTKLDEKKEYRYEPVAVPILPKQARVFQGYRRNNGKVGTRNQVWIIPTVSCVNRTVQLLAQAGKKLLGQYAHVDDCIALTHPYGCSQMSEDQEATQQILADFVKHPNAGAVLIVGLGCENNNVEVFKQVLGEYDDKRVKFIVAQEAEDEFAAAENLLKELFTYAGQSRRTLCPFEELVVGLKCGGSDGLSGITANPLIGTFSDLLVGSGGTAVLTEVPEMFGAETLLMNRSQNAQVFHKMVDLINSFKNYFESHHQTVYENPSPGNKKGGISTLEDKSLGCVQKGGRAAVVDVLEYGQCVEKKGLQVLQGPGNDAVSTTALAAAGCQLILFSTGRGTPWGTVVPTVKISTNHALSLRKQNWIDFNAGSLVNGQEMNLLRDALVDYIIAVASGQKAKAEEMEFHEIAIWKNGVTM
ncbi:tagaturonate reductase [Anaerosinus massiliensis]|uniref:tagaturonate reductase n=1 Tax=Massilibacillus massiliensis TaxID=1806837 RepID=UPI000B0146EE|nr:tagaturonate reductase [Massilibacillus massiliensis]